MKNCLNSKYILKFRCNELDGYLINVKTKNFVKKKITFFFT